MTAIMPIHDSEDSYALIQLEDGSIFSQYLDYEVDIDINGLTGPNLQGRDQFRFSYISGNNASLPKGTVYPQGSKVYNLAYSEVFGERSSTYWRTATSDKCDSSYLINSNNENQYRINNLCAGRVLEEDAMNY